jgi:hypothetical protein
VISESRSFAKHNFDHTYNRSDPRSYFSTLRPLDYRIHRTAIPVFARCANLLARQRSLRRVTMVDLCAGYGVNAALLRHRVSLDDLYDLYDEDATPAATNQASVTESDKRFFASRRIKSAPVDKVVGIDVAPHAVRYAENVGLLDYGASENLECGAPSDALCERLANATLITVTGGMGYIGPQTFEHILTNVRARHAPWIVAFPLLTIPLEPFCRLFARFGLRTEIWEHETFPQRRFADETEFCNAAKSLGALGLPAPKADEYHQTLMICARPTIEADAIPLREIMAKPRRSAHGELREIAASL